MIFHLIFIICLGDFCPFYIITIAVRNDKKNTYTFDRSNNVLT